jgi:hypothetical protein
MSTEAITAAAKEALEALDTFMSGQKITKEQNELQNHVYLAGCYAAAAYEDYAPKSGGEAHAMTRAFLLALIDPSHEDFDYLRSDPAAAAATREARDKLNAIAATQEQSHD